MRVSSSGSRSVTRTMRTRSRDRFDSTRAQNVSGSARQPRARVRSSASSLSSWVDPASARSLPCRHGGSSCATRSRRRRSTSKSARSWPVACTPTRSGTASLSTYTRCKGGGTSVSVTRRRRRRSPGVATPSTRSGRVRSRLRSSSSSLWPVRWSTFTRPSTIDDDAIAHARSTPQATGCHGEGTRVANSPAVGPGGEQSSRKVPAGPAVPRSRARCRQRRTP